MRRGLIARSPVELPDAVLDARLARVRAAMTSEKLDALLIYSNIARTAGVSWLSGFLPYWSEALLVLPRAAAPYLVVALSFRVKSWIERTSRVAEVLHHPRIGLKAAQQIAAGNAEAAVGIVDFSGLPAGIADDLRAGGPDLAFFDASPWFARLRGHADPAEIALAAKAGAIAWHALSSAQGNNLNAMIAAVEGEARLCGAEEVYVAAAPDVARDAHFIRIEGDRPAGTIWALRATVAYKGTWVRMVRTNHDRGRTENAVAELARAAASLPSSGGFSGFTSWLVEGCRLSQPLEPLLGSHLAVGNPPPQRSLVTVQGVLDIGGLKVPVAAPALFGDAGEPASLLLDPTSA